MIDKIGIGLAIKEFREGMGLSQTELAEILHAYGCKVSHASISRYENGIDEPKATLILALTALFHKRLDEIIPLENNHGAISSVVGTDAPFNADTAEGVTETWRNRRKINTVCINDRRV